MKLTLDIPDKHAEAVLDAFAERDGQRSQEIIEQKLMQVIASAVIVRLRADVQRQVESAFGVQIPARQRPERPERLSARDKSR